MDPVRVLRRLVSVPLVLGLTALLWTTLPLWLLVAAAASPFLPGRWRAPRLLWMVVVYLTMEAVLLESRQTAGSTVLVP